ncbi:MAG TPA: hypothetical protein VMD98_04860 [Bryocella sp.]|nr:hypothetical protein [Bryocella sp.]
MADQLGMIPGQACAVKRQADALLRSLGTAQVTLRLANASSGDTQSQLGLEAPASQDLQISPASVKALEPMADGKRRIEVILSITSLAPIAKTYQVQDITAWLRTFEGVVWDTALMRIEKVTVDKFLGADCLFHLTATE